MIKEHQQTLKIQETQVSCFSGCPWYRVGKCSFI